ncbi:MurR/RpiR family transcriptional regulator [Solibacillus sp. MA9]|uniref:MurR/RpiR family transcriptional regulator n=1 Tax=Solibacillus palustris TaxID=2908203 RepID=A0ABS9UH54_9BACL|nr:MurR/RpiR family transcriptional regulator [Solibacillus sp. MA9]MCH7323672.1 MurR/RpiR family transcriptional regulator [Solibacillus sp. MA9]
MSICDEIKRKYIHLSKGQRKVAQFVSDNPNVVATQIASEVGRLADVSESTVIRFCYAMDLSGFSELQDQIKAHLIDKGEMTAVKKALPTKKIKNQLGAQIVKRDLAGISKTFNGLVEHDVEQVIQLLHSAKRIHFLGFRQSAPAAFWMYNNLKMLRENVFFIPHEADKIAQQLAMMDEQSLLVVFALDEEYEDVATTVEIAKHKNVKVIAIRDKPLKTDEPANIVLYVPSAQEGGATCTIAIFALLHVLVEEMVSKQPQQYEGFKLQQKRSQSKLIAIGQ